MRTIYLSGPMTGHENFNIPAFDKAAESWRTKGYAVLNPADTARTYPGKEWSFYMKHGIRNLLAADAVAVLPGWKKSKGATLEVQIARALQIPIYDALTGDLL